MKTLKRYFWVFFLWNFFSLGCFCAPFIAVTLLLPIKKNTYLRNFEKAADRLCAAMFGFSGRQMLSTELTHASYLKWMYHALNTIEPNHCEDSSIEEHAYCRLSDKKLGSK